LVLFNIFANGIIAYISDEKAYEQAVEKQIISGLLSGDNLATGPLPPQQFTKMTMKYCKQWNVKCNFNTTKVMVFKEEGEGGVEN
jgi:hypothetical protein